MESYGPTYISYTKLWAQHLINRLTVGRLHAELAPERLFARQRPNPPQENSGFASDAWWGAGVGVTCNPLSKADFVTGTGAANALRPPSLSCAGMFSWSAAHHAARMQYVLADERVSHSDYTERGLVGELVDGVYTTAAMSAFAAGYGVGWVAGAVVSGVLLAAGWTSRQLLGTCWQGPGLPRSADTCGNLLGALLGVGAGCVAAAGPYAALLAARLPVLPFKVVSAALGCVAASLLNRASWLHQWARAARDPSPVTP